MVAAVAVTTIACIKVLMEKLNLHDRTVLGRYAVRKGLCGVVPAALCPDVYPFDSR
jgi:hypothetical protein